mgnify:CR=1 FL=1
MQLASIALSAGLGYVLYKGYNTAYQTDEHREILGEHHDRGIDLLLSDKYAHADPTYTRPNIEHRPMPKVPYIKDKNQIFENMHKMQKERDVYARYVLAPTKHAHFSYNSEKYREVPEVAPHLPRLLPATLTPWYENMHTGDGPFYIHPYHNERHPPQF